MVSSFSFFVFLGCVVVLVGVITHPPFFWWSDVFFRGGDCISYMEPVERIELKVRESCV